MKKKKNPMYPNWQDGGPLPKYISPNKQDIRNPSLYSDEFRRMYNPDEAVRNWHIDYINSPKYKERLRKQGYTDPNKVIYDRRERVKNATIVPQPDKDIGSAYSSMQNKIFMDNDQVSDVGTTRDDILSHEMSHVINSSVNARLNPNLDVIEDISNTSLSEGEERYIGSRNKNVGDRLVYAAKDNSVKYNKTISHVLAEIDHDYSPYESKSDMDSFRYMLKQEGIYDAGREDFTPDILKKARSNKAIKKSFNSKRLFKNFSDKDLIDIMNNVALNSNSSPNTAKFGKKMYAEGGKSEEPKRRRASGPNAVNAPNPPAEVPKTEANKPFAPYAPTGVPIYNYTPAQGDNPNITPQVPTNPVDQDVYEWTRNYIQSPKYQERLSNFYKYPEYIQRQRAQKASTVGFLERLADNSGYVDNSTFPNQLNINTNQLDALKASRAEVAAHELGHISNASDNNPALRINPVEENFILSRNRNISPNQIQQYRQAATEAGFPNISGYLTDEKRKTSESHDAAPSENLSDIQALRYLLNKNKIYDARVQDITPEQLQRAKQNKEIINSFSTKRLFDTFDDQGLIDILNKVASNNNTVQPIAQDGTKLKPAQEKAYQAWRAKLPKGLQYEGDYDLRGLYIADPKIKPSKNMHFPDTYKLPNHPTFSNESRYFNDGNRNQAGYWQETDSSFNYIPYNTNIKDTIVEKKSKKYGGKMPPAYRDGGFINGNMFQDIYPNYVADYNGNDNRGIPPPVYEFGGQAPSDAIPVQGPFPYQTYGNQSGYGQIPPPKVYANGGIVPTSNSFAGSPFPRDYMYETYPSYVSEYPESPTDPVAYLAEAKSGIKIKPENRGKFNATKKRTGKSTEELTHSKNPKTRKRAIFAQNAAKWNHAENGGGPYGDILPVYNPMNISTDLENAPHSVEETGMKAPSGPMSTGGPTNFGNSSLTGLGNMTFNTAGGIMGLGALSNSFTAQQNAVNTSAQQTRRNITNGPVYNPYQYGTGSTALFDNGGSITDNNSIQQALMTLRNAGYDIEMD